MKKLISILILSISLFTFSSITFAHEYYGIVQGNGTQSTVYLQVNDTWQQYTVDSDYTGYSCQVIYLDQELTSTNYKEVKITNMKPLIKSDYKQAYETINAWNIHLSNR